MVKRGFLNADRPSLYPEGSGECALTDAQKQKMAENEMQHKANTKMEEMMNRGGGGEVAPWYTPNFPKGCQYNSPGCLLESLAQSDHASETHRKILCESSRWKEALTLTGLREIRLTYCGVKDSDLTELCVTIREIHETLELLDLSCNDIMDSGAQSLAVALSNPRTAPLLREIRLNDNKIGPLGQAALKAGLGVMRKKLKLVLETPECLKPAN